MLVKCINNKDDKRLELGGYYTINTKLRYESSMSLVGMGGKYMVSRFINDKNEILTKDYSFVNKRYNPPYKFNEYGYVRPVPNKQRFLENKLYKIKYVKTVQDFKTYPSNRFKRITIEGEFGWYNAKNFLFYTDTEAEVIKRDEKIEQITKKIK